MTHGRKNIKLPVFTFYFQAYKNELSAAFNASPTFPIARQTHWRLSRCATVSAVDCNSPQVVRLRRDVQSACTISVTCTYIARSKVFIHNTSARHCYYSHYRCEPCKVKHDVISADTELWLLLCNRLTTSEEVQARDALRQTRPGIKDNAGIWQTGTHCDF